LKAPGPLRRGTTPPEDKWTVMAKRNQRKDKCVLVYPRHVFRPEVFRPEEWLRFIELRPFAAAWKDLGLDDEDQLALQVLIMLNPTNPPVVEGTGGLRKVRFAPVRWRTGKRGALRVGYVYLQDHGVVLLVIAYSKDEKDNLTPGEKKAIRSLIQRIEQEFATGVIR
jgi:hypothetical protein